MNVVLYIAQSLDGYLADKDGGVDWLPQIGPDEDYGYGDFLDSIDGIIVGRKTYDFIDSLTEWYYSDTPIYVPTHKSLVASRGNVIPCCGPVREILQGIEEDGIKRLWVNGGSDLISQLEREDLIDLYTFFIVPKLLGEGIPVLNGHWLDHSLRLTASKTYPDGVVLLNYAKVRAQ